MVYGMNYGHFFDNDTVKDKFSAFKAAATYVWLKAFEDGQYFDPRVTAISTIAIGIMVVAQVPFAFVVAITTGVTIGAFIGFRLADRVLPTEEQCKEYFGIK